MKHIIILFSLTIFTVLSESDIKLAIKWVIDDSLPSIQNPILLENPDSKNVYDGKRCKYDWYKVYDKTIINQNQDDKSYEYDENCNLLIKSFDLITKTQLDFYRLDKQDERNVYALAYLKSFNLTKHSTNKFEYTFSCEAVISVATDGSDDELLTKFQELVESLVEFKNGEYTVNPSGGSKEAKNPNFLERIGNKIIGIFKKQPKDATPANTHKKRSVNTNQKYVADITVNESPVTIFRSPFTSNGSNQFYHCKITLLKSSMSDDNDKPDVAYTKSLNEPINESQNAPDSSSHVNLNALLIAISSLLNLYFYLTNF